MSADADERDGGLHGHRAHGCDDALDELERYLDGELPETELSRIRAHLTACYPCTERATFEEQLRALVRKVCADRAPSGLLVRIRARLDASELSG